MRYTKLSYAILVGIVLCVLMYVINVLTEIIVRLDKIEKNIETIQEDVDTLGKLVRTKYKISVSKSDLDCLIKNIYYEAGNQNNTGKFAVAHVTLNRLQHGYWGDTICKVVYAPSQFSWTKLKKLPKPNHDLWKQCKMIALETLNGARISGLEKSLFYHADYIKMPKWAAYDFQIGQIGQHIFYSRAKSSRVSL